MSGTVLMTWSCDQSGCTRIKTVRRQVGAVKKDDGWPPDAWGHVGYGHGRMRYFVYCPRHRSIGERQYEQITAKGEWRG